jgi:gephyrin
MRLDPRVEFHRVIVKAGEECLRATSTGGQRSSRVASLSGANGLVQLPTKREGGPDQLEAGSYADAVVIGELQM